jgi:hypothetical protein
MPHYSDFLEPVRDDIRTDTEQDLRRSKDPVP